MKKLIYFAIIIILACNNQADQQQDKNHTVEKVEFFPVKSFFAGQVHLVDSLQLPVFKYVINDNKTDSALISANEFKILANEFMEPDITQPSLSPYYRETGFADQSIPSVTLNYSATNKDLEIQRMDVVINPNPVLNDKVKSIYIEKVTNSKESSILKKLYWKSNKNFQIITFTQSGNQQPAISRLKVVWDNLD